MPLSLMRNEQPVRLDFRGCLAFCMSACAFFLGGCADLGTATPTAAVGVPIAGKVIGGQQVVTGSKIYLYATSSSGYGTASTSLLGGAGYVTSSDVGQFSITGDYTCPSGAYVYLLALGGNPGLPGNVNNPDLGLMAALGPCSSLTPSTFTIINEITTVAAAYALAQFATSETAIGTSSTNAIGLQNAFATVNNLQTGNGYALTVTPAGNGTPPTAEIYSLANALASCVNTDGTGSPCASLMSAANVTGADNTPIDTIQAAINIAHNPGVNASTIYNLSLPNPPFQPTLTAAPNDWTMAIVYTGGINQSQGLAIDSVGNIWIANLYSNNLEEFSNTGTLLSPTAGFTSPSLYHPQRVAIDLLGNIWTPGQPQQDPNTLAILVPAVLAKFSSNGTLLSGNGFTGGGYGSGFGILVDGADNVWTGGYRYLAEFTNAGAAISPTTGYTGGGLGSLVSVALDSAGDIWAASAGQTFANGVTTRSGTLSKFSTTGVALSPSAGYTGGGMYYPEDIAIDSANNLWAPSFYSQPTGSTYGSVAEFNFTGTALSPSTGYANSGTFPNGWVIVDGAGVIYASNGCSLNYPCTLTVLSNSGAPISGANGYSIPNSGFAPGIDSSGNLWVSGISTLTEMVGLAAPTVTPLVKAVATGKLGARP